MRIKHLALTAVASAMLIAPVAAQAGTSASNSSVKIDTLSMSAARNSAAVKRKNKLVGGAAPLFVIGAAGVGAAAWGIRNATHHSNHDGVTVISNGAA